VISIAEVMTGCYEGWDLRGRRPEIPGLGFRAAGAGALWDGGAVEIIVTVIGKHT